MPRPRSKLFPTPDDAENAFYDAFERADLAAMMAVWAESDDIVCVHPSGPRRVGFDAVRESWAQVFGGGSQMRVRATERRAFEGQGIAVHNVIELVAPAGGEQRPASVFATNVYVLGETGWRLAVHHASAAPEAAAPRREEPAPAPHTLH
jgi:ketosteroid isomerase-like protein